MRKFIAVWSLALALVLTLALVLVLELASPARGAEPVLAIVQSACPTLGGALGVIEAAGGGKNKAFGDGHCIFSSVGVSVTIVAIRGEVVWAGDGLDDLMYLVEIEDGSGFRFFSWLIAAQWPDLKAQLAGDRI